MLKKQMLVSQRTHHTDKGKVFCWCDPPCAGPMVFRKMTHNSFPAVVFGMVFVLLILLR
jgi:hypothetical protein